jgi:hypothetical protein
MRDKRFIAEHRGGPLKKEQHRQLIKWARECSEHVLPLVDRNSDMRLLQALQIAREWENGTLKTGAAMKASLAAHAVATESSNPVVIAVARSVGHAVATAHMSDHSLGAAIYALKAIKNANKSVATEKKWQNDQLPSEIRELVLTTRPQKEKGLKID